MSESRLFVYPGIKFIPLRTSGGELIPESGLFVRIKKKEERIGRLSFRLKCQDSVEEDEDGFVVLDDIDVMESISPSLVSRRQNDRDEPNIVKLQEVHSEADNVSVTRAIPKEEQPSS